jgi:hypothetical protein
VLVDSVDRCKLRPEDPTLSLKTLDIPKRSVQTATSPVEHAHTLNSSANALASFMKFCEACIPPWTLVAMAVVRPAKEIMAQQIGVMGGRHQDGRESLHPVIHEAPS